MKSLSDSHRTDKEYEVGQFVWVRLRPYRQISVAKRLSQKLGSRFYGPFEVEKRIGKVAYRLKLPVHSRIHPVFHVSLLKEYKGPPSPPTIDLPHGSDGNHPLHVPMTVLNSRCIFRQGQRVAQNLIQWQGLEPAESTWEDSVVMKRNFPDLFLEDKESFQGGRNVMNGNRGREEERGIGNDLERGRKGFEDELMKEAENGNVLVNGVADGAVLEPQAGGKNNSGNGGVLANNKGTEFVAAEREIRRSERKKQTPQWLANY